MQRTGHEDFETTKIYQREAENTAKNAPTSASRSACRGGMFDLPSVVRGST